MTFKRALQILLIPFLGLSLQSFAQSSGTITSSDNSPNTFTIKKKKPKWHCTAIENSIRNIRSIKQLGQNLDQYGDKELFDCVKALAKDVSLRAKLKQLDPYLKARKKAKSRPIRK